MFNNPLSHDCSTPQTGENNMEKEKEYVNNIEYNRLKTPVILTPGQNTFEDIAMHALLRQRLSTGTINRNLRYLRFMDTFQPIEYRVNVLIPNRENFFRHMDYREQIQSAGWGALKHEWQAMRMVLKAYGINPKEWAYRPPTPPKYQIIPIPTPDQLHAMIHHRYSKDPVKNRLYKQLIIDNHIIGWRVPSEPCIIKTTDVDLDKKMIKITSPKLHNATRYLDITPIHHKMKNYIDIWRPRITDQHSKDYLYLKPSGRPFRNSDDLRMFLNRHINKEIKTIFPEYYNYTSRHWSAIAHLIQSKIETKHFDCFEVKEHLGHTKIETTMNYLKHAKFYYNMFKYDWIKRVLKWHEQPEENTLNHEYTLVSTGDNRRRDYSAVCRWRYNPTDINSIEKSAFSNHFNNFSSSFFTFFEKGVAS